MFLLKPIRANLQCWLSLAVYVWGLEFQAIIALDDLEPLYDRVIDCAAILLTLAFWAIATSLAVAVVAKLLTRSDGANFSALVCKFGVIVSTGLFFGRWLNNWPLLETNDTLITVILGISCLVLALIALIRRRRQPIPSPVNLPSFQEFFQVGALPVLIIAVSVVWFQILRYSILPPVIDRNPGSGTSPMNNKSIPNVILVVADGLRASSMSLYGYQRDTTPNLRKLAARGNLYNRAYSNVTATQASLTTLLTGKHPLTHGRMSRYQRPYDSDENLLKILRVNGYTTAAVVAVEDASSARLGMSEFLSVNEVTNFQLLTLHELQSYGIPATRAGNRMREDLWNGIRFWLGLPVALQIYESAEVNLDSVVALVRTLNQPFFLFVHIFEPHEPYESYPPFKGMYSSTDSRRLQESTLSVKPYYRPEDQLIIEAYRDRYDETIRYLDAVFGKSMDYLDQTAWRKNLLLIFTSDHGESFEHGYHGHGEDLHEGSVRVPLIIQWPFHKRRRTVDHLVQSIDLAPTILHAAGIPVPSWMEGQVLGPETDPSPVTVVAINHPWPKGNNIPTLPTQLAIWSQHNKIIADCETGDVELFDLLIDRTESNDLSDQQTAKVDDLTQRLQRFLARDQGRPLRFCSHHITKALRAGRSQARE